MKKIVLSLLALAVLTGCGGEEAEEQEIATLETAAAPAESAPAAPAPGALTDPEIADIVVAANQVDVEAGELAKSKATNPEVREFAERMITDHTAVNQQATELVTRLGVTPEESPTSQQLRQAGEQNRQALQGKSGAEFDRAYIDNEVAYHQQVLDAIDDTLIPNAENPELKALLEQTRPAVAAHLEHAKELQASLES
jgi:putative membrane protein